MDNGSHLNEQDHLDRQQPSPPSQKGAKPRESTPRSSQTFLKMGEPERYKRDGNYLAFYK
jgi:hypothetical protein